MSKKSNFSNAAVYPNLKVISDMIKKGYSINTIGDIIEKGGCPLYWSALDVRKKNAENSNDVSALSLF